jgi:Na+/H+ antiporter NhaD/arsenite permease-like protein
MNRATIAVVGATALVVVGAISLDRAFEAIDLDTLALLFGMMVLNANLRIAGFFDATAALMARHATSPRRLLALVVAFAGALSALFLNDTIVIVFTPLVIEVARAAGLHPVPFLVAVATAANVGSAATIVGNPQNMLIGVASGIPFTRFLAVLAPVAASGLVIVWATVAVVYRGSLAARPIGGATVTAPRLHRPLLRKSLGAAAVLLAALLAGAPPSLAAMAAAALLLVTRRLKPDRVFQEIDWALLVFFAGLFVVTAAAGATGFTDRVVGPIAGAAGGGTAGFAIAAAVLSNLVSNVPAVMLLSPVVAALGDPERAWLTLAMATTLAGNLTLLGSVANLIVAESAARRGVTLGFVEYLKAGVPITVLSIALGVLWLS